MIGRFFLQLSLTYETNQIYSSQSRTQPFFRSLFAYKCNLWIPIYQLAYNGIIDNTFLKLQKASGDIQTSPL